MDRPESCISWRSSGSVDHPVGCPIPYTAQPISPSSDRSSTRRRAADGIEGRRRGSVLTCCATAGSRFRRTVGDWASGQAEMVATDHPRTLGDRERPLPNPPVRVLRRRLAIRKSRARERRAIQPSSPASANSRWRRPRGSVGARRQWLCR